MKIRQLFLLSLFLLIANIAESQVRKSRFSMNINSPISYYDKSIVKKINYEIRSIPREKHDSVLVFIEDKHFTDTKAYLIYKRKTTIRFFALLFNTLRKEYCVVEFKLGDHKFPDIIQYHRLAGDSSFTEINDPLAYVSENYGCYLYLGMGNQDFLSKFRAQNFLNDKNNLFEFVINTYKTKLYQDILTACDKFYTLGLGSDFKKENFISYKIKNYK